MKVSVKGLGLSSLVYLVSGLLSALIPFLAMPLFTKYLSAEEYGMVGLFQGVYTIFLAIVGFGVSGSVVKKKVALNDQDFGIYNYNVMLLWFLSGLFISGFLLILVGPVKRFFDISPFVIWNGFWYALFTFLLNVLLAILQAEGKTFLYSIFQVLSVILNIIFGIVAVVYLSGGGKERIYSIVVASALMGFVSLVWIVRNRRILLSYNRLHIRDALYFGVPLIPHGLTIFLSNWASLFLLKKFVDTASVGIYLFAFQLSMVLGVACDAFNRAYVPWLFEQLKLGLFKTKIIIVKMTYVHFLITLGVAGISFFIGPFLIKLIFSHEYHEAKSLIGILVLGQAFGGMYLMVTNYLFYLERTAILSAVTIGTNIFGLFLGYFLIREYQLIGAAYAFLVTRIVAFLLVWWVSSMSYSMPWRLKSTEDITYG